jgi:hypothetical protein
MGNHSQQRTHVFYVLFQFTASNFLIIYNQALCKENRSECLFLLFYDTLCSFFLIALCASLMIKSKESIVPPFLHSSALHLSLVLQEGQSTMKPN